MTTGPFDQSVVLPDSEYGGGPGLIDGLDKGHEPTPSERLGVLHRTDASVVGAVDPVTELDPSGLSESGA